MKSNFQLLSNIIPQVSLQSPMKCNKPAMNQLLVGGLTAGYPEVQKPSSPMAMGRG